VDKPGAQTGAYSVFMPNLANAAQVAKNPIRRRLRDQYVAARFPAFANAARDFRDTQKVIRYARELFDGDEAERAIELLRLAIEEDHRAREAWLALIELSFLQSDPGEFCELIVAFAIKFPGDATLPTQRAMAHELAPQDPAFANAKKLAALPNWSVDPARARNQQSRARFHAHLNRATSLPGRNSAS
jgi:hypothetical protein